MLPGQVAQSSLHAVARDGVAHGLADREPHLDRARFRGGVHPEVDHQRRRARASSSPDSTTEAVTVGEAMDSGEHGGCRELWPSDRQALAALAATAGQDRATGAGPHAQTETVHLVTATVVRLVGTLAHGNFSEGFEGCPLHCEVSAGPEMICFGRHRPPTRPPGGGSWTCGTRRHGATGQRYAVGKQGVKPTRPPGHQPVDDVLPGTHPGCYVPPLPGLWISRSDPVRQHPVTRVTVSSKRALTCTNVVRTQALRSVGSSIEWIVAGSSQLVENSVDADRPGSVRSDYKRWKAKAVRWTTSR